jgi:hypothetical protein
MLVLERFRSNVFCLAAIGAVHQEGRPAPPVQNPASVRAARLGAQACLRQFMAPEAWGSHREGIRVTCVYAGRHSLQRGGVKCRNERKPGHAPRLEAVKLTFHQGVTTEPASDAQ